jgi:hypothetical protein
MVADWKWIIKKVDKRIGLWCNICLSMGRRLLLAVLDAIPFYWLFLTSISKSILNGLRETL